MARTKAKSLIEQAKEAQENGDKFHQELIMVRMVESLMEPVNQLIAVRVKVIMEEVFDQARKRYETTSTTTPKEKSMPTNPELLELLQFFKYAHLPEHLQETSKMFHDFVHREVELLPDNYERIQFVRKMLEAKDCAVRSRLLRDQTKDK